MVIYGSNAFKILITVQLFVILLMALWKWTRNTTFSSYKRLYKTHLLSLKTELEIGFKKVQKEVEFQIQYYLKWIELSKCVWCL